MSFLDKLTAQLPFGTKAEGAQYFFALNINLSEVTAAVWSISGSKLDVQSQATLAYEGTEDLLDKAYKALDQSLGTLDVEPQKILFGVPESWGLDDDLKEPYLKLLRRMLKEFDLTPMAYVTTANAISFLLQKQEGAPSTALLLGIGDYLEITLVKGGKIIDSRSVKRSEHLHDDIEKLLRQFTDVEVFPSKILLYPTKMDEDLAKIKDDLMSYPWMQRLPFLHFPKIESLDKETSMTAITLAGAVEINPQVDYRRLLAAKKQGLVDLGHRGRQGLISQNLEEEVGGKHLKPREYLEEDQPEAEEASSADSGFVKGDIKEQLPEPELDDEEVPSEEPDIALNTEPLPSQPRFPKPLPRRYQTGAYSAEAASTFLPAMWLDKLKSLIPLKTTPPKSLKLASVLTGKLILLPLLMMAIAAAYIFLFKANVTIFVEPQNLEQNTQVIADPKATSVDEDKKIIPATTVETTVTGSDKASATGQKQIGDPAKGKAVIYNLTDSRVSFSQGTVLTANGLKFTLDSSVQIASQSSSVGADFTTVIKPGKSDPVGVTASAIGPDGNLPADSDMVIGNYAKSQVVARVDEALSGGTSKNVTVVTADDQKKLQAKVLDDLRQKAETDLQGKMDGDKKIITEALTVVDGKYNFNKQAGDQASEFSLNATVRFKGTAYSDRDLKSIVSKLVQTNVPDGFELNLAGTQTQANVDKVDKDGRLIFKATFKAQLLPKLNLDDLRNQMRGQSVESVANKLKDINTVVGSDIKLTPSLPSPLGRLPLLDKNITITVTPK